jgi:hypothetical protein
MPESLEWVKRAKQANIPVVIEYDDDVLSLDPAHPAFHDFRTTAGTIVEMLTLADAIIVSTQRLKTSFERYAECPIVVIPNAINEKLLIPTPPKNGYDPKKLVWRCGASHWQDLEIAKDIFTRDDIDMTYMGILPPYMRAGRDKFSGGLAPQEFVEALSSADAGCLAVPLRDHNFNRGRSNCSWLEATWAGLPVAHWTDKGTDDKAFLPEFQVPGVMSLDMLLGADGQTLRQMRATSLDYIHTHLTLEKVNPLRAEVLLSLV